MYRKAFDRPKASDRPNGLEPDGRSRIPRNDGRAEFLETTILVAGVMILAIALGLLVGVPLAMMLNDICASLKC